MNDLPHIAILCSRLDLPGGIERAVVNTANIFSKKGHAITLIILDETKESFYPIHSTVKIIQQPLSFGITPDGNVITRKIKLLTDVLKLRKILKDLSPDIIICSEYPFSVAAGLAGAKKRSRILSWEHHHFYELKRNAFWERMFQMAYPRLDGIVCLNDDEKKLFEKVNLRSFVIPNFVQFPTSINSSRDKTILTVARLTHVKGIDLLLPAAKEILLKHPEWKWKIIGDGDMKEQAESFIQKEGLQNRLIIQPPIDHNIINEYQNASLYVMTSRNECFPMTLLEAMSGGLPCIAFDCETGPRHIIQNNKNGLLVEKENTIKMSEAISSMVADEEKRKKMGEDASESVHQFSAEKIYDQWQRLFSSLLSSTG